MQYKQTLLKLLCIFLPSFTFSQTTFLPQGAKEYVLLDRMEIKAGTDSVLNFSKTKPFSRRYMIPQLGRLDSSRLTKVDRYNLYTAMVNNIEWATGSIENFKSKKPIGKNFYHTPATLLEVNNKDFFLAINPVFQYTVSKEKDNSEHLFQNTRGITVRGRIADKVGFSAYVTDNQERDPSYVQQYMNEHTAVPGNGYYKNFKAAGGVDYFDARGYVTFGVTKYIDVVFGYDKNFIGNGYRSLFLSDFSSNYLFLKLNTRIWKFNYQNIFMELTPSYQRGGDQLLGHKYASIHHLDMAVTKWLNVGIFEAVVFGRKDHFEFAYLNPVMFIRASEQQAGSPDNALAGLDLKANVAHRMQFYGQMLLDEFKLSEIKANKGWWGNKYGYQLGMKYVDAFGIPNLDIQLETNRVRPFTYSHNDSVANYTHYNQPLAHPLGANFQELIALVRFQPIPKLTVLAKAIYYTQGKDTGNVAFGSNIFAPNQLVPAGTITNYPHRTGEYGYNIGSGLNTKTALGSLLLSYEVKPNLFVEVNGTYRSQSVDISGYSAPNTFIMSAGIRWNMHRKEFDF